MTQTADLRLGSTRFVYFARCALGGGASTSYCRLRSFGHRPTTIAAGLLAQKTGKDGVGAVDPALSKSVGVAVRDAQ